MNTTPSAISAKLRKAGFGIVATRNREGIRVTRGALAGQVTITVDHDSDASVARTAILLENELKGWRGYTYTKNGTHFTITKEA